MVDLMNLNFDAKNPDQSPEPPEAKTQEEKDMLSEVFAKFGVTLGAESEAEK